MPGMNRFFSRWGIWTLLAFALLYYGQYYRAGLYPAAEGGVEGMTALRLMAGWRPIADTFLGYNLLWFYPIVGLFKLFGPSYTVLRLFFFILCTMTGLMSFRIVRLCTGSAAAAFLAGLLVLLIPGQMFRNYMAFIVVLNLSAFLPAFVLPAQNTARRLLWMATCGVTLAIAWLIRVDVGFFLTLIWLGLVVTYPLRDATRRFAQNCGLALLGTLAAMLCFAALHLPFYQDAVHRGFAPQFVAQYGNYPSMIEFQAHRLIDSAREKLLPKPAQKSPAAALPQTMRNPAPALGAPSVTPASAQVQITVEKKTQSRATLARRSLTAASARDTMLALNLYLPILAASLLALGALGGWLLALWLHDETLRSRSLILLTSLGCSLTLFPQYFFWRPDMVHLSEFMVPMTMTLVIACALILLSWKNCGKLQRLFLGIFLFVSALTLLLYVINACQSQSSGGIAASVNKRFEFRAANGVRVKLTRHELQDATAIYRLITATTTPRDFVICYPYNPEINFMTDRPSYEYNFYIDNAMSPADFYQETVGKIQKYHPATFVITDWPINNTEESKFSNWASETYAYIKANYKLAYKDGNLEVFVRPDLAFKIPANALP
jgi:hypothetical protein